MDRMLQIQILREHLITLCRRSARIFRKISETSHEHELKRVSRLFSQQRQEFVEELLLGGFPLNDPGEVTESYRTLRNHREFPDLIAQIKDCAEKERSLLRVYSDALEVELSENLRELITRQKAKIEESFEYIQSRLHMYQPHEPATTSSVRW